MNLCYRGINYKTDSTTQISLISSPDFKYRGVSYSCNRSDPAQKISPQNLIYRGVNYSQSSSKVVKQAQENLSLKSVLT